MKTQRIYQVEWTINLETELKVSTITEDVVIETGIYDRVMAMRS